PIKGGECLWEGISQNKEMFSQRCLSLFQQSLRSPNVLHSHRLSNVGNRIGFFCSERKLKLNNEKPMSLELFKKLPKAELHLHLDIIFFFLLTQTWSSETFYNHRIG